MKKRLLAHRASLALAFALIALAILLFALQPQWRAIAHWQSRSDVKTISGYLLLTLMIGLWLPHSLRQWFSKPKQIDIIKLIHQWMGVVSLLIFLFHANVARSGFLALQTMFLLTLCGLGAGIVWTQLSSRTEWRRSMLAIHIVLAFVVSGFAVLHLYFIYAHAG
ncbi:MAG: hypothetical protein ABL985_13505 [Casimicrobium sp.]